MLPAQKSNHEAVMRVLKIYLAPRFFVQPIDLVCSTPGWIIPITDSFQK